MTCKGAILRSLAAYGRLSTPAIVARTGYARGHVWGELVRLRRMGVVVPLYRRGNTPRRWSLRRSA